MYTYEVLLVHAISFDNRQSPSVVSVFLDDFSAPWRSRRDEVVGVVVVGAWMDVLGAFLLLVSCGSRMALMLTWNDRLLGSDTEIWIAVVESDIWRIAMLFICGVNGEGGKEDIARFGRLWFMLLFGCAWYCGSSRRHLGDCDVLVCREDDE